MIYFYRVIDLFVMFFVGLITSIFLITQVAQGISIDFQKSHWTTARKDLKSSLQIPLRVKTKRIIPSKNNIFQRATKFKLDQTVEPLYLPVPKKDFNLRAIANKYAKPQHRIDLYSYLVEAPHGYHEPNKPSKFRKIILDESALSFTKLNKFRKRFMTNHHKLVIDGRKLRSAPDQLREFSNQINFYFNQKQLNRIKNILQTKNYIRVDDHLLSKFAKRMVKKFPIFRGPNCFHASVAFQEATFPNEPYINLKRESRHHSTMINHDELWRVLNTYFYEISPKNAELKYGDIIAFFEIPFNSRKNIVNYRWLKHASTYLFGGYVFSKGSKSPNTPYSVKTLDEEWKTWEKHTKNLGVKVFRRSFKNVKRNPPLNRTDWLY